MTIRKVNEKMIDPSLVQKVNDHTTQLAEKAKQTDLNTTNSNVSATNLRVDGLVINSGNANAEVTDAHVSTVKNKTFTTVRNRFEDIESDFNSFVSFLAKNIVNNGKFSTGANWTQATGVWTFNGAANFVSASTSQPKLTQTIPTLKAGNKYYFAGKTIVRTGSKSSDPAWGSIATLRVTGNATSIRLEPVEVNNSGVATRGSLDTWIASNGVFTSDGTENTIGLQYGSVPFGVADFSHKDILLINLSETFGVGKEPSATDINNVLSKFTDGWFDKTAPILNAKESFDQLKTKTGIVYVSDFGAIGDGVTDDTIAIQNAANSISRGILSFESGKKYKLTNTIQINVIKIRGVQGNNALLMISADLPAIRINGGKNTTSATPAVAQNQELKAIEFMPYIKDLQIYSNLTFLLGTGIQISGAFAITISNCHLFSLKKGIELIDINRNLIVSHCHIWDCKYGIHWNVCNLHQQNITGNHISYCEKAIFFEDSNCHNIQITGNDVESGATGYQTPKECFHFLANTTNGDISQVLISGNTVEGHDDGSAPIIHFENNRSDRTMMKLIVATGNEFSGQRNYPALRFKNCTQVNVTGNSIWNVGVPSIDVLVSGYNYVITGNSFNLSGGIRFTLTSNNRIQDIAISNNVLENLKGRFLLMKGDTLLTGARLNRAIVSHNIGSQGDYTHAETGWIVEMGENIPEINEVSIAGNTLRLFNTDSLKNGIKLNTASLTGIYVSRLYLIAKDNIMAQILTGSAYDLPTEVAGRIINRDNLFNSI